MSLPDMVEATERYRAIFDRAPVALWDEDYSKVATELAKWRDEGVTDLTAMLEVHPARVVDLASLIRIVDVNRKGLELIGARSKNEALKGFAGAQGVFTAEVRSVFIAQFQAIWDGQSSIEVEQRAAALHGRRYDSILYWQAHSTATGPDYSSVLVAIWDITALSVAKREIEELSVARQDLIDHVSHSLRKPLNAVLRYAQSMQAAPLESGDSVERREIVDALAENAQELATYIEALFIQARLSAGSLHIASLEVDVTAQLMQVTEQLTEAKTPTVYKGGKCVAMGDPQHVRHIIQNLLIVATRRSTSTVETSVSVERENILFDVIDDGMAAVMSQGVELFDSLELAGEPERDPGVAELKTRLSVSRGLARRMGGDVIFERIDGRPALRLVLARASG